MSSRRDDPRGGHEHLTLGQVGEQRGTAKGIEFAEDIVENEYRWASYPFADDAVGGELQREREAALLTLRRVCSRRLRRDFSSKVKN